MGIPPTKTVYCASLDDAYDQKYFSGGMSTNEIIERIQKKTPRAKFIKSRDYIGLWIGDRFIMGMTNISKQPRFNILKHDTRFDKSCDKVNEYGDTIGKITKNSDFDEGKALARSYLEIFRYLKRKGIEYDEKDLF
ncbi:MAG: hypothetical protein ACHQ1D_00810 [Nitrososphaerales archaeon]